jgi:hypothetical protein
MDEGQIIKGLGELLRGAMSIVLICELGRWELYHAKQRASLVDEAQ